MGTGGVAPSSLRFSASATFESVVEVQRGRLLWSLPHKCVMNFEFLFRHKMESLKSPVAPLAPIFLTCNLFSFKSFTILLLLSQELKTQTVFT